MASNLDRFKADLDTFITKGELLHFAMQAEYLPEAWAASIKRADAKTKEIFKSLPSVSTTYQSWYSAAKALIRQLLPDRLDDFVRHYEKPKSRKNITYENYRIE